LNTPNAYGHRPLVENDPKRPDLKDEPDNDCWDHVDFIGRQRAGLSANDEVQIAKSGQFDNRNWTTETGPTCPEGHASWTMFHCFGYHGVNERSRCRHALRANTPRASSFFTMNHVVSDWRPRRRAMPACSLFLCLTWLLPLHAAEYSNAKRVLHTATLESQKLRVVIADNTAYPPAHQAGYNGVAELQLAGSDQPNLFVPRYSGLNLEHIFSGDAASYGWHIFEPRQAPMELRRTSMRRVELRQERTKHWPLRSRLVHEVKGDAIDLTYYGTPQEDFWRKHGYIGVFFASYIQSPEDMAIQFIGRSRPGRGDATPRWIKHLPTSHGVGASHRPAGSTWDPSFDEGFKISLASGFSDFEYVYPFYFGRSGENVLVMMFEKPHAGGEMRFAQSPSGGGSGNPAWDFVYFRRDYAPGREFKFRVRAVYRKFTHVEDIVRLYERWSGERVRRPD